MNIIQERESQKVHQKEVQNQFQTIKREQEKSKNTISRSSPKFAGEN